MKITEERFIPGRGLALFAELEKEEQTFEFLSTLKNKIVSFETNTYKVHHVEYAVYLTFPTILRKDIVVIVEKIDNGGLSLL